MVLFTRGVFTRTIYPSPKLMGKYWIPYQHFVLLKKEKCDSGIFNSFIQVFLPYRQGENTSLLINVKNHYMLVPGHMICVYLKWHGWLLTPTEPTELYAFFD